MKNFVWLLLLSAALCQAATVSFGSLSGGAVATRNFTVPVLVSDVTDLYTAQFSVEFDSDLLSFVEITEGALMSSAGPTFFIPGTDTGGAIEDTAVSLIGMIAGASGNGVLAHLTFRALAPGTAPLDLFNVLLLDSSISGIPVTTAGVEIEIAPIPEPASWTLFGGGLLAVALWRRRC